SLLAEADGEFVSLARVEHSAGELGRFAQRDRENTARERIERAAVADLGLRFTRLAQHAFDRAYRLGRAEAHRLVEDDPAVEHLTVGCRRSPAGRWRYGQRAA